ncbi:MAG: exo-alpha-sialidase [Candidatus Hydrogenedentes bacterium]|nr:exo-alpha-sialidase [Candidatus Hydrogenedentota bacterium]
MNLPEIGIRVACIAHVALAAITAVAQQSPAPPTSIAEFQEKPVMVQLKDGTLAGYFVRTETDKQIVTVRTSGDLGDTWSEESPVLEMSTEPGYYNLPEALVDRDGEVHLFFINAARTVQASGGEENRPKTGDWRDSRLDIWHARSRDGRTRWEAPKKVWEGYTGALNSVIQMDSGRILLPFSCLTKRTWANRGDGLAAFTFYGQFDSTLIYSDDGGDTWTWPDVRLKVPTPDIVAAYGSVEPVVIQLKDGRVWMLIRTQQGRFYESFSNDGATWSDPMPSAIVSSDSPAGIVRLTDGRLVLFWNNCQRYPYAYGGRQVLHAAISDDDGAHWQGYREVARDPLRNEPPPPGGDHGTAYPFPFPLNDGRCVFVTGQGYGRVLCKVVDPAWLLEKQQREDFSTGLENWSVFGTKGVELTEDPQRSGARVLSIRKVEKGWPACAVWNFPANSKGALTIRLRAKPNFQNLTAGITDHFSAPFDYEDRFNNLFTINLGPIELSQDKAHTLEFRWDCLKRTCDVSVDGAVLATLPQTRWSLTPCYLRLRSETEDTNDGGVEILEVSVDTAS